MRKSLLALSAFVVLFTASCKKDKDEEPAAVTPTTSNVSGTYRITKITAQSGTSGETDVTTTVLAPCERDDQYTLNTNLTFSYQDAGVVCSPSGSFTGTWSLPSATTIEIDGDVYNIRFFNGTRIELSENISGTTFVTYLSK